MSKVSSFIKQTLAILTGDTATVVAEKNFRRATSALKTQIAIAEGDLVSKEEKLEIAKENLSKALVNNGVEITDNEQYVQNLLNSQNNVTNAESDLKKHQAKIEFLQSNLKTLSEEVEA